MKQQSKILQDKMVDFKHFGIVLLAVGVFFYLGVIIPFDNKSELDINIMMVSSMSFLAVSIFFFIQSKLCQHKLTEMDQDQQP